LGHLYRLIEKFDKALECFRCARLLIRRLLPERVFDYCRIVRGLGSVYFNLRNATRVIYQLRQAITLQNKSFPDNHTEIPVHFNGLAHGSYQANEYHRALLTLDEAKNFSQTKMPVDHQGYGETLHLIGLVHCALGNDHNAQFAFIDAAQKQRSLLDKDHPRLTSTYYQLSLLHTDHAHYQLARQYIEKALDIQRIK
jgi:tetratricopeptide (TPR) repeat protein